MITVEKLEAEQKRHLAKIVKNNRIKIKRIYAVLKDMNLTHVEFQESLIDMHTPITSNTRLVFVEKSYVGKPIIHVRRYHHFIDRGLQTKSHLQYAYLYLAAFRNKNTGELRIKFGITGKNNVDDRMKIFSDTWEFVDWICEPRKGEKKEIEYLEKELKRYCSRNGLLSESVQDFSYGGKTELLRHRISAEHLAQLCHIFSQKSGFESLCAGL